MKKSKFSEEQIAFALRMVETGTRVAEVWWKFGITDAPGCAIKKILRPAQKRKHVEHLRYAYRVSERRACMMVKIWRSSHRYCSQRKDDRALRMRIRIYFKSFGQMGL